MIIPLNYYTPKFGAPPTNRIRLENFNNEYKTNKKKHPPTHTPGYP